MNKQEMVQIKLRKNHHTMHTCRSLKTRQNYFKIFYGHGLRIKVKITGTDAVLLVDESNSFTSL